MRLDWLAVDEDSVGDNFDEHRTPAAFPHVALHAVSGERYVALRAGRRAEQDFGKQRGVHEGMQFRHTRRVLQEFCLVWSELAPETTKPCRRLATCAVVLPCEGLHVCSPWAG